MGRYIFTFVMGLVLFTLYDRFFSSQQRGWFIRWRAVLSMSFLAVIFSFIINTLLGR